MAKAVRYAISSQALMAHACAGGLAALLVGACAGAETSAATLSLVSDDDYRGVTQTANGPALQGAIDYTASLLHVQAFTSNVTYDKPKRYFGSRHTEFAFDVDTFGAATETLQYVAGINFFLYPGQLHNEDYGEIFGTLTRSEISASLHYAPNYDNLRPWLSAAYFEGNGKWPIGTSAVNVLAHAGISWGPYWIATNEHAYVDYFLGAESEVGKVDLALRLVGTRNYAPIAYGEALSGRARVVLSITVTTP